MLTKKKPWKICAIIWWVPTSSTTSHFVQYPMRSTCPKMMLKKTICPQNQRTSTIISVVSVQVGSQVSGNIAKLFVDFNSQVKAGQVVAQIDPAIFQATVTQAEGDLASAQAALELAKVNAVRTQELFTKKNSSQADVDQAMANLHQAEANVKIKQGALDKAKADLDHCTITSPVDGVVISRIVDVG